MELRRYERSGHSGRNKSHADAFNTSGKFHAKRTVGRPCGGAPRRQEPDCSRNAEMCKGLKEIRAYLHFVLRASMISHDRDAPYTTLILARRKSIDHR